MKRLLIGLLLILASVSVSLAQNPVVTTPSKSATISPNSANIDTTNAFKLALPASTNINGRIDCLIQNQSASAKMYIYFGAIAAATTPNSLQLAAAEIFRCANSGVVIKDAISITGTAGDRYFAAQE